MLCNACPRKCNVDRRSSVGFCGVGEDIRIARAALHFWEEPCISGKNGSGAVFFSGCSLRCVFCQNNEISRLCEGKTVSDVELLRIFERLVDEGAENINLVTPTHYAPRLAGLLEKFRSPVPIVYNCGGYESVETLKRLEGLVDIYLPDFKYISSERAEKYSKAKDYPERCAEAIAEMKRQQPGDVFDERGMMVRGVIIRHLVLPKNTNQSVAVLEYIGERFGTGTYLSLMSQYTPCGSLEAFPELRRRITEREYEKVVEAASGMGFMNVFTQELSSAEKAYIPDFDLRDE